MTNPFKISGKHLRTLVIIDSSNMYAALKALNLALDYRKLFQLMKAEFDLVSARFYIPVNPDMDGMKSFIGFLQATGYQVTARDIVTYTADDGTITRKGNMDGLMIVDGMSAIMNNEIDHLVLFSGDGDFVPLIQHAHDHGVKTTVCSMSRMIKRELAEAADSYVNLVAFNHLRRGEKWKEAGPVDAQRFSSAVDGYVRDCLVRITGYDKETDQLTVVTPDAQVMCIGRQLVKIQGNDGRHPMTRDSASDRIQKHGNC